MSEKPSKPSRMGPSPKYTVRPVEDPAEQAALDEKLDHLAETTPAVRVRGTTRDPRTAASVLEQAAELSPEERLELMEQLVKRLPSDALHHLERLLRQRRGQP